MNIPFKDDKREKARRDKPVVEKTRKKAVFAWSESKQRVESRALRKLKREKKRVAVGAIRLVEEPDNDWKEHLLSLKHATHAKP